MTIKTIQFIRRGERVSLANVPPTRTLLEVLREDLQCTGTKEGCNEGDCGACTVVLGELTPASTGEAGQATVRYRAVNSCIRLAHSIDGMALWTVEDLAADPLIQPVAPAPTHAPAPLHPAQEAMVQNHASQCGFCTPGFVMSLFAMYQNHVCQGQAISRELAQEELSGNLCRCTGYRPILDAAQQMQSLPAMPVDETSLLLKLKQLSVTSPGLEPDLAYIRPTTLAQLLAERAKHPQAQIVAGCTDVGLWINKMHMHLKQVLDVTRVHELRQIERHDGHLAIGAAATLTDAFAALVTERPQLHAFATRFAGLPVRNAGTLGGNVANGSPIGDSMPLLIALGASVVLMSLRAGQQVARELPLEQLYTGYRKNVMAADEVLAWVKLPPPLSDEFCRAYKISKRFDDDISAVCLALSLRLADGQVAAVSIGAGGVAATPVRAVRTEAALRGRPWTQATVQAAISILRTEFQPISDMRASSSYRTQVLGNLLQRFWLESQGLENINLESFRLEGEPA